MNSRQFPSYSSEKQKLFGGLEMCFAEDVTQARPQLILI